MRMVKAIVIIVLAISVLVGSPLCAASKYRNALKNYWQKQLKEEGLSPIYYASSIHAPKSVWTQTGSKLDYFSSGLDLLPDLRVPFLVGKINLPDVSQERELAISASLQLAGVKEVADADLDAFINSKTEWKIQAGEAEMHFIAKRDARRCTRLFTGPVLADYFTDLKNNEKLFVVVKAVFVKSPLIEVTGSSEAGGKLSAEMEGTLEKLGFEVKRGSTSKATLKGNDMYYAVGLRELTSSGLKSSVSGVLPAEATLIELPEAFDSEW